MLTKEQIEDLERMAGDAKDGFARACRDPSITVEDYEKLRRQYNDAMRQHHAALGY